MDLIEAVAAIAGRCAMKADRLVRILHVRTSRASRIDQSDSVTIARITQRNQIKVNIDRQVNHRVPGPTRRTSRTTARKSTPTNPLIAPIRWRKNRSIDGDDLRNNH